MNEALCYFTDSTLFVDFNGTAKQSTRYLTYISYGETIKADLTMFLENQIRYS